ncbi:hypothetical protein MYCTH_2123398 [Thermothelomyces thermophilus ATCC 42464]|uniref:Uncharacterized protein n=1 Tax=Thermothelomyces thermophilus (strain ATCC 42464 / BCRC 31852 / DSM 1799) TaxID=573729 RepID=G2Q4L4_THET4|nr:uncharacterized protein MYCTH_2123398 [Thermothelomyces thermophilus ATCC 42464]AEO54503.1 hypothetical protein MYCTH_2123398 [Thermothelomyces thermophilus ATCC 42464]
MPPPKKRSYLNANLDHSKLPQPKKRSRPEVISLISSDSEPEADDVHENLNNVAVEGDNRDDPDGNDVGASPKVQSHRPLSLIEQLQLDAFDDLKADLCFELDSLCESASEDAEQGLRDVLRQWAGEDKASRHASHLYYRLDHKYCDKRFPPEVFVRRDATVTASLSRVAGDLEFELFLALLDRDDSSPTLDYLARSVVDIQNGHELISYIPVDDNNVLQAGPSLLKTPASGCETAILIIPRDGLVDFVMQYIDNLANPASCSARDQSLEGVVKYFISRMVDPKSRIQLLPIFRDLCIRIWQLDGSKGLAVLPGFTIQNLLTALVQAEDWSFLEQAASRLGNRTPLAVTVSQLLANGAESVVASLACKIVADVALIPRQEFPSLWLPFLGHLLRILEERKAPLSAPRYRHLFAAILETYLARCVGPFPFEWTPKLRRTHCRCTICNLFTRFLSSSVSVASFSWLSYEAVGHINATLIHSAWHQYRCQFRVEDGMLVVRKLYEVDPNIRKCWTENMEKATLNIGKLDGPALREILGDDYPRIRNFDQSHQMPQQASPVPIESLDDLCEGTDQLTTSSTPGPTTRGAPSNFTYQPQAAESCPQSNPSEPPPSGQSPLISYASLNRPNPATAPRDATSIMRNLHNSCGISRNPGPALDLNLTSPFNLFCEELGASLRRRGGGITSRTRFRTAERRWLLMSEKEKEPYILKAQTLRSPSGSNVGSSPHAAKSPSQPAASWFSSNPVVGHSGANVGSGATQPPTPASISRLPPASSPSLSRVFGAPASSSRLNSLPSAQAHSQGKIETVTQATSGMAGKQQAALVIDLTGDG